jgi:hypothetical protein
MNNQVIVNPIHQVQPFSTLKPSYGFVSTDNLIESFGQTGWYVAEEKVAKVRKIEKQGFQRHIIRLHHDDYKTIPGLSEANTTRPELIVLNSHDGSSRLRILLGMLRMVCLNGIIAGTSLREFGTTHSGDLTKKLTGGIEYMTSGVPDMIGQVQVLQNARFTQAALEQLVKSVVDERLKTVDPIKVNYGTALAVTRNQDAADDAFTVFNRLQERLMRGGIEYTYNKKILDSTGNVVDVVESTRVTRRLNSIPQAVKLNRMAYDMAVQLAA